MEKRQLQNLIGVDTGGTFTDFVCHLQGRIFTHKVDSTPPDYSQGVIRGLQAIRAKWAHDSPSSQEIFSKAILIVSSTLATNALLQRRGVSTALITTKGFADVVELGRQARSEIYNLHSEQPPPLVARRNRHEVDERISAQGSVLRALHREQVDLALRRIKKSNVSSVALCLIFSYLNPQHERLIAARARKLGLQISVSSEIAPEHREYERTCTTVVNAYVSPVVKKYLTKVKKASSDLKINQQRVVLSNGGSASTGFAGRHAVRTLLSGPAAGVMGAQALAQERIGSDCFSSELRLITFDMGGTSTDVSLIHGQCRCHTEHHVGHLPIQIPMLDIHTIGAGGGSISFKDSGGALRVGPRSAGAHPGPVCYGKGHEVTVTDANLLLGRLHPAFFLNGERNLDEERARYYMGLLAKSLGCSLRKLLLTIVRIVNAHMEKAIRFISVERGFDPRSYTLVSYGGAGGLHVCALAENLEIPNVWIPKNPGVLSAWGAMSSNVVKDYVHPLPHRLFDQEAKAACNRTFKQLINKARQDLLHEGIPVNQHLFYRELDLRYKGQSYALSVPYQQASNQVLRCFHELHAQRHGHCAHTHPVELVSVRLKSIGQNRTPELRCIKRGRGSPGQAQEPSYEGHKVYERDRLLAGNILTGPALVVESFATTYLAEGWQAKVDPLGHLRLRRIKTS